MAPSILGMNAEMASALFKLKATWGDRYLVIIGRDQKTSEQTWQVARIGSSATFTLRADTAEELNARIGIDYQAWQAEARRHNQ